MSVDSKLLDHIKPGADTTLALLVGCIVALSGERHGWFPQFTPDVIQLLWLGVVFCGSFTFVGMIGAALRVRW